MAGWWSCTTFDNMTICLLPSVSLEPDESKNRTLRITVPEDWAGIEDITYPFAVTAIRMSPPIVNDTAEAGLTIKATKRSMAEYVKHELQWLRSYVEGLNINFGVKRSLLSQIGFAILAEERALNYIIAGKERLANNWLTACKETINASIHEVQTLSQRQVPEHDANNIIELAKEIVQDLEKAIVTPIE
jgi:hypothetical protein